MLIQELKMDSHSPLRCTENRSLLLGRKCRDGKEKPESSTKCYHKRNLWDSVITTESAVELQASSHAHVAYQTLQSIWTPNRSAPWWKEAFSGQGSWIVKTPFGHRLPVGTFAKLRGIRDKDPTLMRTWMEPVAFADMKYQKLRVQAALDSCHTALLRCASSPRKPTGVASRYKKCPRKEDSVQIRQKQRGDYFSFSILVRGFNYSL